MDIDSNSAAENVHFVHETKKERFKISEQEIQTRQRRKELKEKMRSVCYEDKLDWSGTDEDEQKIEEKEEEISEKEENEYNNEDEYEYEESQDDEESEDISDHVCSLPL
ncbi:hypothetical protein RFI_00322 [Reticulomyxa filosa]|uniref:Uncharacterized protein n=1 Tax=Reticulomyxa filosa TaxID=46433 RepID=X6PFA3_RETFI|nr:hypothetical protein RFI_00322 [Reticulomyxa filosa]|eukprot:ETO36739.1 hypothetical protein RFI_00322 [Reticulomyxa filosa]